MSGRDILVLGGGASGLITSLRLQESFPGCQIVLCADFFGPETSSVFCPSLFLPLESSNWSFEEESSWEYLKRLAQSQNHRETGVFEIPCYLLGRSQHFQTRLNFLSQRGHVHRTCTPSELTQFGSKGTWNRGTFTYTFMIDPRVFLSWALKKFQQNGGHIRKEHIRGFDKIDPNQYGLVVNCSGLGARKLCRDALVVPKASKIVQVEAPWIKTALKVESRVSILPGLHQVSVHSGIQYSRVPQNLWAQACQVMPRLKDAAHHFQDTLVWRSHRIHPRLEFEQLGSLNVIHNYGHGDSSVVLAPGFADAVIHLCRKHWSRRQLSIGRL